MDNALVAFFSETGTTEEVAKMIAEITGGDLFEILPAEPYTISDLNYSNPNCRALQEQHAPNSRPAISDQDIDLCFYDVIFLGSPIWDGEIPKIIVTFIESGDLTGKTIVPFVTSASSGLGTAYQEIEAMVTEPVTWLQGKRFVAHPHPQDVEKWIESLAL